MKQTRKCISIILILMILFGLCPISNAQSSEVKDNIEPIQSIDDSVSDTENIEEEKPKCKYIDGEVIITYEQSVWNSSASKSLKAILEKYPADETIKFEDIQLDSNNNASSVSDGQAASTLVISLVKSNKYTTEELIDIFKDEEGIISVEPNYIIESTALTNDTYEKFQWALENNGQNSGTINSDINPITTSSKKEKVIAILDSGIDYTHEDLKNVVWKNPYSKEDLQGTYGYDFENDDDDPMDDKGHGTNVAGIIAAETNNNTGISGITLGAPNIKIMSLKVLDNTGHVGKMFSIIKAYKYIYQAQQLGTNIIAINNSWSGYLSIDNNTNKLNMNSLIQVINLVGEKGALSICSAGNDKRNLGDDGIVDVEKEVTDKNGNTTNVLQKCKHIPSCLDSDYIISVTSSNEKDELAGFSNYGRAIDIAAPGTDILTTDYEKNGHFIPSLYDNNKIQNVCKKYYNFENIDTKDIPFTANVGKLSISEDTSFGTGKKSLKWEFDAEDVKNVAVLNLGKLTNDMGTASYMIHAETDSYIWTSLTPIWENQSNGTYKYLDNGGTASFNNGNNYWSSAIKKTEFTQKALTSDYLGVYVTKPKKGHCTIYIDDFGISKAGAENKSVRYKLVNGTSFSTPYVAGAVGIISNLYENDTPSQLKDKILSCTRKVSNMDGKVKTGGILDLTTAKNIIHTTGITLDKTKINLLVGKSLQLSYTITPEYARNKNVIWKSSNSKVATVKNGNVTAVAGGTATITATTEDGNFVAKCEVVVSKTRFDISNYKVEGISTAYYTGNNIKYDISIYNGDLKLIENTDYTVTYTNNKNVGAATVEINGIGTYTGKITKRFKILNKPNISTDMEYYLTSAFSNGRALDLKNASEKTGNNIVIKTLNCGELQRFKFIRNDDGTYCIQHINSKKYIGIYDKYVGTSKAKVLLTSSSKNYCIKWYIEKNSNNTLSLYTREGLAIEIPEDKNNSELQINTSSNTNLQKLLITSTNEISAADINTSTYYCIVSNINNKKAIDVYAAGTANFTNVDIYNLNRTNAQQFKFQKNDDGSYMIINKGSNKALDVYANNTKNMTNVDIYTSNNTTAQKWYAIKNSDNTISFLGLESGKALDLYAADVKNFNNIHIWSWNHTDAQKWKLIN